MTNKPITVSDYPYPFNPEPVVIGLPANIVRCPVCKMPLSRPLTPESHLPGCWIRQDLEKLKGTDDDATSTAKKL